MKQILTITFALFLVPFAIAQQYGWMDISKNLPDLPYDTLYTVGGDTMLSQLRDVFFINDNEGWVASAQLTGITDSAVIFHTMDEGDSWEVQYVYSHMNAIWMLDSQTGYAGAQAGLIYVTHDGGQNWDFHGVVGAPVTDMYFPPNSDTGFVCCHQSTKYYVIKPEGVEPHDLPSSNVWTGISATNDGVWVCGGTTIICIKDGVINWHSGPNCGYWTSMFFLNDEYGWIGNDCQIAGFVGPDHWSIVCDPDKGFTCIHAISKDLVWATLIDGRIMHTQNGSEYGFDTITSYQWSDVEWETQNHPHPNATKRAIFFTSAKNGYVVANQNVILKYTELSAIGEQQFEELEFEVFPNPCQSKLTIKVQTSDFKYQISDFINLEGKTVKSIKLQGQENTIDLSDMPAGVYFIKLQTENAVGVRKIIIQ